MRIPRRTLLLACALLLSSASRATVPDPRLRVVTTIPDLADIAQRIGGPEVLVNSICNGNENLHHVVARPSHLVMLSKADLFVQVGLWAESTWLPSLLRRARNPRILIGEDPNDGRGFIDASEGWKAIQVPETIDRSQGDLHPGGNPHFNLHPAAGRHIAARVLAGFLRVDPTNEAGYRERYDAYLLELTAAEERWREIAPKLRGKSVVVYHMEFNYLTDLYGMETVASIELKPGIPPTPAHLATVIEAIRKERVGAILTAPWSDNRFVEDVAKKSQTRVLVLPTMARKARGEDGTWIGMMDAVHSRLVAALTDDSGESHGGG